MISVSGIGPKMSMNILSGISAQDLLRAISGGNVGKLVNIPGVGKKMAERLILELKEKVIKKMMLEETPAADDQHQANEIIMEDALSALVNLGYKSNIARDAIDKALRASEEELGMDQLLKKTLKILAG
jgi:Holliday junction DNA helicase RuvA